MSTKLLCFLQKEFLHKYDRREELEIPIRLFDVAIPFIVRQKIRYAAAISIYGSSHPLAFRAGDTRIVPSGNDHHGFRDVLRVCPRRDRREKISHIWLALVAILDPAQVSAVCFGVLEK